MTIDEYRLALESLSEDDLRSFGGSFGGGPMGRGERVREFAQGPHHERLICFLLTELGVSGLKTEDEKLTDAALLSAGAARESAQLARESAKVSRRSLIVAAIATAIALGSALF